MLIIIISFKNNFLILGEDPTYGINGSFGSPEKNFSINFTKANIKFCFEVNYNADDVICLLMEKKSLSLKKTMQMLIFQHSFASEVYLIDLVLPCLEKYL